MVGQSPAASELHQVQGHVHDARNVANKNMLPCGGARILLLRPVRLFHQVACSLGPRGIRVKFGTTNAIKHQTDLCSQRGTRVSGVDQDAAA